MTRFTFTISEITNALKIKQLIKLAAFLLGL